MSPKLKILYIGNRQSEFGKVASYMEFFIPYLKQFATVYSASGKKKYFSRFLDWALLIICKGYKANWILIDVYSGKQFYGILGLTLLLKCLRLKYTCILHGGNLPSRLDKNPICSKFIFLGADHLIAPSNFLKSEFGKRGYLCKVIPNAVDSDEFIDVAKRDFYEPRLLYVRGITSVYNPLLAVKILKDLKSIYPNVFLCMIGYKDEKLYNQVIKYVENNNLTSSFEYKGVLKKEEWFKIAKDYTFYLSTTNYDNTPVSLIEAMNLGLIVVSTNVGGVPFLIDNEVNGLLYEKGNNHHAFKVITQTLQEKEKCNIIIGNSLRSAKEYRIGNVLKLWKSFLKIDHVISSAN